MAVDPHATGDRPTPAYRRSAGTERGEARRRELLSSVTADVEAHGLADFSLRRAARAAGTTHKVLLYHFGGVDDLLAQAVRQLRQQRIDRGLDVVGDDRSLAERVRSLWPVLTSGESEVLDQAIGLAVFDPTRHADLGRGASEHYLPSLIGMCPPGWSEQRRTEVAQLVLASLRGFLIELRTGGDPAGIEAGFRALVRALEREERAAD